MSNYVLGLTHWLIKRSEILANRLSQVGCPSNETLQKCSERLKLRQEGCLEELRTIQANLTILSTKGNLNDPKYVREHLVNLHKWERTIQRIEYADLTLLETWSKDSDDIQGLLDKICQETKLPSSVQLLIALYSNNYFYIYARIIYIPRLEGQFLLHLPDLYHEIGHEFWDCFPKINDFKPKINSYFEQLRIREESRNSPTAKKIDFVKLINNWEDNWLIEFACDAFAAYLCGPAFGWSHFHLCAMGSPEKSVYTSGISHPADQARWDLIGYILQELGWVREKQHIDQEWNDLAKSHQIKEPDKFSLEYPQALIQELQQYIKSILEAKGLNLYYHSPTLIGRHHVSDDLNDAWNAFWKSPQDYPAWETAWIDKNIPV